MKKPGISTKEAKGMIRSVLGGMLLVLGSGWIHSEGLRAQQADPAPTGSVPTYVMEVVVDGMT